MKNNIDDIVKNKLQGFRATASGFLWYKLLLKMFFNTLLGKAVFYFFLMGAAGLIGFGINKTINKRHDLQFEKRIPLSEIENQKPGTIEYQINTKLQEDKSNVVSRGNNEMDDNRNSGVVFSKKSKPENNPKYPESLQTLDDDSREEEVFLVNNEKKTTIFKTGKISGRSLLSFGTFDDNLWLRENPEWRRLSNKRKNSLHKYEIALYFTPAVNQTLFSTNENLQRHIDYRNKFENPAGSYSGGFSIKYYFNDKIFYEGGFNLNVINNTVDYHTINSFLDEENSYYVFDTTWLGVYDPPIIGDSILSVSSTFFPVYYDENFDYNTRQQYRYFNIPVLGGYYYAKNLIEFEAAIGFSFGWKTAGKGEILSINNYEVEALNLKINKFIFQHIGQIKVAYLINAHFKVFVAPGYKIQINNINKVDNPVRNRFLNYGIRTGLAYRF